MSFIISYLFCLDDCGELIVSFVVDFVCGFISLGFVLIICDEDQVKVVLCEVVNCLGDIGVVEFFIVLLGFKIRIGNVGSFYIVY